MDKGHRLVEHFFRREYGRLVATLARQLGEQHLEIAEDAAQSALMAALESWARGSVPSNPSAWLFRVAKNEALQELRTRARRGRILRAETEAGTVLGSLAEPTEVEGDMLRMLFVCCDEGIPEPSRLVLALKTICGFDVPEIARRLFVSEANVYKRLSRARARLREGSRFPDCPAGEGAGMGEGVSEERVAREGAAREDDARSAYDARLSSVQKVLYVLFAEGHLSLHDEMPLRQELCDEAIRLTTMLATHVAGSSPETYAMLALMHFHVARMPARQDAGGGLLLLEEQNRALWDRQQILEGFAWLGKSATGDVYSRYHAEAAIAAEHCRAPSFQETRWDKIAESYALLEAQAPSPLHALNRALAIAEWKGPRAGLVALEKASPPSWLEGSQGGGSHYWPLVLADLHRRCGDDSEARRHGEAAIKLAPTEAIRALIARRLDM